MEPEKAPNLQGTVEKEKQSWGHHNAGFRAVLQRQHGTGRKTDT